MTLLRRTYMLGLDQKKPRGKQTGKLSYGEVQDIDSVKTYLIKNVKNISLKICAKFEIDEAKNAGNFTDKLSYRGASDRNIENLFNRDYK